jgi:hypothetical protein
MVRSLQSQGCCLLVAEMHKLGISDGTDMNSTERHFAFQRMGFAPLYFPYIQPPLTPDGAGISTDLLLLAHCDMLEDSACVPSIDLLEYLDGFCGTVFGFEEREAWTDLSWYQSMAVQLAAAPFVRCLDRLPAPWREEDAVPSSSGLTVVVGSCLVGLSCALALRRARRRVVVLSVVDVGEVVQEEEEAAREHVLAELARFGVDVRDVGTKVLEVEIVGDGHVDIRSESRGRANESMTKTTTTTKAEHVVVANVTRSGEWTAALRERSAAARSSSVQVHFAGAGLSDSGVPGDVAPQMQVVLGMRAAAKVLSSSTKSISMLSKL